MESNLVTNESLNKRMSEVESKVKQLNLIYGKENSPQTKLASFQGTRGRSVTRRMKSETEENTRPDSKKEISNTTLTGERQNRPPSRKGTYIAPGEPPISSLITTSE